MKTTGAPAAPIRCQNVVENYRQLQKTKPRMSFEYGVDALLNVFTLHDFSMFSVLEQEFGTEKAVNLYANIWKKRTHLEWSGLKKEIGLKPNAPVTMDDFVKIMEIYFETFGNPIYLTEKTDERVTFRVTDCPYTTQILWNMFSIRSKSNATRRFSIPCLSWQNWTRNGTSGFLPSSAGPGSTVSSPLSGSILRNSPPTSWAG
jgi:hypothetical protein